MPEPAEFEAGVEKAVANRYASLLPEEAEEQSAWGEFALREFSKEAV
jgi:hypothetical protein